MVTSASHPLKKDEIQACLVSWCLFYIGGEARSHERSHERSPANQTLHDITFSLLHHVCSSPSGRNADNPAAFQNLALLLFSAHLFCLHPHSSSFSHFPSSFPTFLLSPNSHTSLPHLRRLSHSLLHKVVVRTFNKVSNTRYEPTLPPKGRRHLGKLVKMESFHPNLINNICIFKH